MSHSRIIRNLTATTRRSSSLLSLRLRKVALATIFGLIAIVLVAASWVEAPRDPDASSTEDASTSESAASTPEASTPGQDQQVNSPFVEFLDAHLEPIVATMTADDEEQMRLSRELHAVYEQRSYRPAWLGSRPILQRARVLHAQMKKERLHGLDSALYTTYVDDQAEPRHLLADIKALEITRYPQPNDLWTLETRLTLTLLRFTRDLYGGQVETVDLEEWHKEPAPVDVVGRVVKTMESDDRKELKRRLTPSHEGFKRLAAQLQAYQRLVDDGGWPTIPEVDTLEVGDDVDPDLFVALVGRLQAEGDLEPGTLPSIDAAGDASLYSDVLANAVERFQARHGLTVDGKLGSKTRQAMNVAAVDRLRQIEANLERWRWLPDQLPPDRIEVNVPAFELRGYRQNVVELEMVVAVGKPSWATPIFEDEVLYAEVNPYWNIPPSIAADEVLPAIRKDPTYLQEQDMEVVAGWNTDDPTLADVDWTDPGSYGVDYRIRQRPGAGNALGQIKFIFPNPHGVYLHDTPAQRAFERANRAVSHGCVRVAEPMKLADFLLPNPDLEEVEVALDEGGAPERVYLDEPMPVTLHYWTAFVDDQGTMHFRRDLYGIDEGVSELLDDTLADTLPGAGATSAL